MNLDDQRTHRVLLISVLIVIFTNPSLSWHRTLTYSQRSSYEVSNQSPSNEFVHLKFLMWYRSFAIFGARERLILLRPHRNSSSVSLSSFSATHSDDIFLSRWNFSPTIGRSIRWPWRNVCRNGILRFVFPPLIHHSMQIDQSIVHFSRINVIMMSFTSEFYLINSPWMFIVRTLIDHWYESSTFKRCVFSTRICSFVILIRRWTRTVLMSCWIFQQILSQLVIRVIIFRPFVRLKAKHCSTPCDRVNRQALKKIDRPVFLPSDSIFVNGFQYDGKAVFGVIETSERFETVRVAIDADDRSLWRASSRTVSPD